MIRMAFIASLAAFYALLFAVSFRILPRERWQMLASIPLARSPGGDWTGLNLTYYGFFTACGVGFGTLVMLVLQAAAGIGVQTSLLMAAAVLSLSLPAARLLARTVERKRYTFTSNGALFVGIASAPWVILLLNRLRIPPDGPLPVIPALAAAAIAFAFGEGIGRLACISFGCCYGRRLRELRLPVQRFFERWHFIFTGPTKKAAYEGGLEGVPLVPIQAITAIVSALTGLLSAYFYLGGRFTSALLLSITLTQAWRIASEFLRSDFRGAGRISVYQILSAGIIFYAMLLVLLFPAETVPGLDLRAGLASVWRPEWLLLLQGLWLAVFRYTGRSMVTGAAIRFHVHTDRI